MENTKSCPYCGSEIQATAKKCKHCGKWVEKQCPQCSEWVNAEAKKCRYCGYWFDPWQRRLQEKAEAERSKPAQIRAEELQEQLEEQKEERQAGGLLSIEAGICIILIGIFYGWAWWGYVLGIIASYVLLSIHLLRVIYCIAISLVWGLVGMAVAPWLLDESDIEMTRRLITEDYGTYWWIGGIVFIFSIIFHWPAMKTRFNL